MLTIAVQNQPGALAGIAKALGSAKVEVTNQLIATADERDQRKLLHENAVRMYGANKELQR